MTVYENVALLLGIALIFLIFFIIRVFIQLEKTLKTVDEIANDVKGKSKKLDPTFDMLENVGKVTTYAKMGYDMINKKKEDKKENLDAEKVSVEVKEKK